MSKYQRLENTLLYLIDKLLPSEEMQGIARGMIYGDKVIEPPISGRMIITVRSATQEENAALFFRFNEVWTYRLNSGIEMSILVEPLENKL